VLNPLLVEEQLRGGIVQGIGEALYEELRYGTHGHLESGTLAEYLVPMAAEMPDIEVGHVETPTQESLLGAKGAGEAGTAGAPGAVMNAINDALRPFGAKVFAQPFTPERILAALGKVPGRWPEVSAATYVPAQAAPRPATTAATGAASMADKPSSGGGFLGRMFGRR
jgi:carbon-monoxide dehydrogenase large subunit